VILQVWRFSARADPVVLPAGAVAANNNTLDSSRLGELMFELPGIKTNELFSQRVSQIVLMKSQFRCQECAA